MSKDARLWSPDSQTACANRVRAQAFQLAAVTSSAMAVHSPVLPQHVLHLVGRLAAATPGQGLHCSQIPQPLLSESQTLVARRRVRLHVPEHSTPYCAHAYGGGENTHTHSLCCL